MDVLKTNTLHIQTFKNYFHNLKNYEKNASAGRQFEEFSIGGSVRLLVRVSFSYTLLCESASLDLVIANLVSLIVLVNLFGRFK